MCDLMTEYLQHLANRGIIRSEASLNQYKDSTAHVLKLSNGFLLPFDKPKITNSFYFGEDERGAGTPYSETMEHALKCCNIAKSEDYFMQANLRGYDELLKLIDENDEFYVCKTYRDETVNVVDWHAETWRNVREYREKYPLTSEEVALIRNTILMLRSKFEKRLKTWYKKYGAKHIKTGTFWTMR